TDAASQCMYVNSVAALTLCFSHNLAPASNCAPESQLSFPTSPGKASGPPKPRRVNQSLSVGLTAILPMKVLLLLLSWPPNMLFCTRTVVDTLSFHAYSA